MPRLIPIYKNDGIIEKVHKLQALIQEVRTDPSIALSKKDRIMDQLDLIDIQLTELSQIIRKVQRK